MHTLLPLIASLFMLFSIACITPQHSQHENLAESQFLKGDLYFKLISFGSFYGLPDSVIEKVQLGVDSLRQRDILSEEERQLVEMITLLQEHELLYKPYIHLRIDSAQTTTVFLDADAYEKINRFDRQELIQNNKKVEITLTGKIIQHDIFYCESIISANRVEGKTYWRK